MEPQLQNWERFCRYTANSDWHGIWTRYAADGQITETLQAIRSFKIAEDGSEIQHQNHYTYADGKQETKTFGPYKKPIIRALVLDNSLCASSPKIALGSIFGCEIGFKHEDRRIEVIAIYSDRGSLQRMTIIREQLKTVAEIATSSPIKELSIDWQGTSKTITSDWVLSAPVAKSWQPITDLADNYQQLHFADGITIYCPSKITSKKDFFYAVDWPVNSNLLQRGICKYHDSAFTSFTLAIFQS
ncbi:MAG: DUF3598 family protein [Aulosira sp. DedQUE10]|nr:DUF3598 family protein [Aulosira sp. DedQUE10]